MKTFKQFREDFGGVGVGSIAGSGADSLSPNQKEPGVDLKKKKTSIMLPTIKRKTV